MSREANPRMARRSVLKLIAAAASVPGFLQACADQGRGGHPLLQQGAAVVRRGPAGTLSDPDLVNPVVPWKLTLGESERATLRALCDLVLPGDEHLPAASALGAHEFIDEWVSAPFEKTQKDATLVREGIQWLDAESRRRFGTDFRAANTQQQVEIADTICNLKGIAPALERPAFFFDRVRELTVVAVYTTREGMADLGYVGNVALDEWKAPPPEVLRLVGLL